MKNFYDGLLLIYSNCTVPCTNTAWHIYAVIFNCIESGSDDSNTGVLIGTAVGGICGTIVVIVVIVLVMYSCYRRKDKKES